MTLTPQQQQRLDKDYLEALGRVPSSLDLCKNDEYYNDPAYDAFNKLLLNSSSVFDYIRKTLNRNKVYVIIQQKHAIGKMTKDLTGKILFKYPCLSRELIVKYKAEIRESEKLAA